MQSCIVIVRLTASPCVAKLGAKRFLFSVALPIVPVHGVPVNQPHRPMCPEEIEAVTMISRIKFPREDSRDKNLASMLKKGLKMIPPSIRPNHVSQMWEMFPKYHSHYRGKPNSRRAAHLISVGDGVTNVNFRRAWRHLSNLAVFLEATPEGQEQIRQEALM